MSKLHNKMLKLLLKIKEDQIDSIINLDFKMN